MTWFPNLSLADSEAREALALAEEHDINMLSRAARKVRDRRSGGVITYSRKVFLPLTHLCRDVCHYCTFAKSPKRLKSPYMSIEQVLSTAQAGAQQGCHEALFTLGEKPELRYSAAREFLQRAGYRSTIDYLESAARAVFEHTSLLPHINAGNLDAEEIQRLRPVSASMGLMLESSSQRLCAKGMPHYGSPDKNPEHRLRTMRLIGKADVPLTSGILIGIGETRRERVESLLALRALHREYGHLQEVIIQNFRAKPDTKMRDAPEPDLDDLLWTVAVARLILDVETAVQVPPNLSPGALEQLIDGGIDDWGGISPLTPDYVNPEAPWPELSELQRRTASAGKLLQARLTIYPRYALDGARWLDEQVRIKALRATDTEAYPRCESWSAGGAQSPVLNRIAQGAGVSPRIAKLLARAADGAGGDFEAEELVLLFAARGDDFYAVCEQANALRKASSGSTVSYVVNRNINYTNICYFKCRFCAFSKGKGNEDLRGPAYDLDDQEIARRVAEAWRRGATEVCLQGGIHPDYSGEKYLRLCAIVREAAPEIHLHAFTPLEVFQGARSLGEDLESFLRRLQAAGLASLPGTAAEILDDEVRARLCPDKITTAQWLEVMETAHRIGLRSTATIMFGHLDAYRHWANHLIRLRDLQRHSGGFSEFVPLPFVHMESPMYRRGEARPGPTFREALLMHAVARIFFHGLIDNIQASWVKLGQEGLAFALDAGANDVGGSLMNESITRAAGAIHGQEFSPTKIEAFITSLGRVPLQRTTLYGKPSLERVKTGREALALEPLRTVSI